MLLSMTTTHQACSLMLGANHIKQSSSWIPYPPIAPCQPHTSTQQPSSHIHLHTILTHSPLLWGKWVIRGHHTHQRDVGKMVLFCQVQGQGHAPPTSKLHPLTTRPSLSIMGQRHTSRSSPPSWYFLLCSHWSTGTPRAPPTLCPSPPPRSTAMLFCHFCFGGRSIAPQHGVPRPLKGTRYLKQYGIPLTRVRVGATPPVHH